MRSAFRLRTFVVASLMLMAGVVFMGASSLACGYHDPSIVARGIMNLAFPKSLYVSTAVWQAQNSGVLPARPRKSAKDLFAYQRAASDVQKLGSRLAPPIDKNAPFAVVLLNSMLWARFVPGPNGYSAVIHVKGPERGDAVLVTEAEVVKALLDGSLDISVAEAHGLYRLYGPIDRQAVVRKALGGLSGGGPAALPSEHVSQRAPG
ncbi:MAG: hypothetical protein ACTSYK_03865 [Alphaproteobacteria bacterium]